MYMPPGPAANDSQSTIDARAAAGIILTAADYGRTHIGCLEVGQGVPVRAEAVGEGLAAEVAVAPDVARKLGGLGREDLLCVRAAATAPPHDQFT
jgi:hypothetical protein